MGGNRTTPLVASARGPVCIADGYGINVHVLHGRLVVRDGVGRNRRERVFPRVRPGISRLVVLGRAGTISLEAIRWLHKLGIAYIHLDRDGTILATSSPGDGDVRLRRLQARAPFLPIGLELSRQLLVDKLAGQHVTLTTLHVGEKERALATIAALHEQTAAATSLPDLLYAEREAAYAYWGAWTTLELRFVKRDQQRIPEHWSRFGQRHSPLTNSPRLAVNPANALLNYLYALLEAETRIACIAAGLDPTLGLIHVDYRTRDSLALDLMEPVRPQVDRYVLELITTRSFSRRDFIETVRGQCKIGLPLAHELSQTAPRWAKLTAPAAEQLTRRLAQEPDSRIDQLTTPLTRLNRRTGHDGQRRRPRTVVSPAPARIDRTCKRCGGTLPHQRRTYCDSCLPEFQREQRDSAGAPPSQARLASSARTHGGDVAAKRGATNVERKRRAREWDERYGKLVDLSAFRRDILPQIQNVSLSRLAKETGLSLRYVSQIRRGEKTPHPRHWQRFLTLSQ